MAWLSGWDQRIKATVDSAVVDADLTQFPVTLIGGTSVGKTSADISAIFDEVGSNWEKIAVTQTDGETELYVEKELWDSVGEKFVLHCSKPGWVLDGDADSDLYIYYDNDHADNTTYVGAINSTPGAAVWDGDYVGVWHCAQASGNLIDSTSNGRDSTTAGGDPAQATGYIGKGQVMDGNDYFSWGDLAAAELQTFTVEKWLKLTNYTASLEGGFAKGYVFGNIDEYSWDFGRCHEGYFSWRACHSTDIIFAISTTIGDANWHYWAGAHTNGDQVLWKDGASASTASASGTIDYTKNNNDLAIGARSSGVYGYDPGTIDEVRFSSIRRSNAWLKACYYSQSDALLTWGSEERVWAAIAGVTYANVARVAGVAKADIATIAGVA